MIVVVDFTGKAEDYNLGLLRGLLKTSLSSKVRLVSTQSYSVLKYINRSHFRNLFMPVVILLFYLRWSVSSKVQTIHFQWLPFEAIKADLIWLKLLQLFGKKIVLTVHNIVPHDTGSSYKEYNTKIYKAVDNLIVHDTSAASILIREFKVPKGKISVVDLGVDFPDLPDFHWNLRQNRVVIFGHIKPYKGISEFIDKYGNFLLLKGIGISVVGRVDPIVRQQFNLLDKDLLKRLDFQDRFIDDSELSEILFNSRYAVFPYKHITGSGALLRGIAHGCLPLGSKLKLFESYNSEVGFPLLFENKSELSEHLKKTLEEQENIVNLIYEKAVRRFDWGLIAKKYELIYG
jgi:glycosyltransferase involved in cell wall biosynthesis